jgi:hypothetical protein
LILNLSPPGQLIPSRDLHPAYSTTAVLFSGPLLLIYIYMSSILPRVDLLFSGELVSPLIHMAEPMPPPPFAGYDTESSPDNEPNIAVNKMVVDPEGEGPNAEHDTTVDDTVLGPNGELTFMRGEPNPQ